MPFLALAPCYRSGGTRAAPSVAGGGVRHVLCFPALPRRPQEHPGGHPQGPPRRRQDHARAARGVQRRALRHQGAAPTAAASPGVDASIGSWPSHCCSLVPQGEIDEYIKKQGVPATNLLTSFYCEPALSPFASPPPFAQAH